MALTRKMLKAMGIEDEKIDQIIEAHTEVTDALKADRDKYKEDADKLPSLQTELDDLKKKSAEKDPFEQKYNDLKKEYDDYKTEQAAKEAKAAKDAAYRSLLNKAGVSENRVASIMKVTDLDKIELDNDGKLKNAEDLEKSIKSEWSDFIVSKRTEGAGTKTPLNGEGRGRTPSRAAQIASNYYRSLYGETKGENG